MSLEFCVLASGSGGNCSMIRSAGGVFLVDAGLAPRTLAARLNGTGVTLGDISAICLTHLDRDHCSPLIAPLVADRGIRIFCPADRVLEFLSFSGNRRLDSLVIPFDQLPFEPVPGVTARSFRLAHDQTGSHAFRFETGARSIGLATDLGRVPVDLIEHFCGVDILAIESNYDPDMQRASGRPLFLQNRIMNGAGHLSNAQALAAVQTIVDRCQAGNHRPPGQVVLLHRSRQCNCPVLLKRLFDEDLRLINRVVLAEQFSRTEWLSANARQPLRGEQLCLF